MKTDDELLAERMQSAPNMKYTEEVAKASPCPPCEVGSSSATSFDFVQWSEEPNEAFRPSGRRCEMLPAGVYEVCGDQRGVFFRRKRVLTDDLIELDDSASQRVISGIRKFWQSRDGYVKRGVIYKRGVLLWGPAGSGKTATVTLLMQELVHARRHRSGDGVSQAA